MSNSKAVRFVAACIAATAGPAALAAGALERGAPYLLATGDGTTAVAAETIVRGSGNVPGTGMNLRGVFHWGEQSDPGNLVVELNVGTDNRVTGVAFDVRLFTLGTSWCSDAIIEFGTPEFPEQLLLRPAAGVDEPCDAIFSSQGVIDLGDNNLPDIEVGEAGVLRIKFWDVFDDNLDAIDDELRQAPQPVLVPGIGLACGDQSACNAGVAAFPGVLPEPAAVPAMSRPAAVLMVLLALGAAGLARRY